ncbi:topoisomerase II, partial [Streptomyces sp. SID5477]|nr:topoisomerase II [Streptomyces sp. SID5477]
MATEPAAATEPVTAADSESDFGDLGNGDLDSGATMRFSSVALKREIAERAAAEEAAKEEPAAGSDEAEDTPNEVPVLADEAAEPEGGVDGAEFTRPADADPDPDPGPGLDSDSAADVAPDDATDAVASAGDGDVEDDPRLGGPVRDAEQEPAAPVVVPDPEPVSEDTPDDEPADAVPADAVSPADAAPPADSAPQDAVPQDATPPAP